MHCFAVLFVISLLAVSEATILHCTNPQSKDTISGDGTVDRSEVTTLQYCIVDNCTMIRNDTGQHLDIIYTTDSLIVATLRGMHTAVVMAKMDSELVCETPLAMTEDIMPTRSYIISILMVTLLVMVTGYNVTIHLVYKKLRNLTGKLLMLYSFFLALHFITGLLLLTFNYKVTIDSIPGCYTTMIVFMTTYISSETVATCILTHVAYVMHKSDKLQQISADENKRLFKWYIVYMSSLTTISFLLILTYDLVTGNWRDTMLANGRCVHLNQITYGTMPFMFAISSINKALQIIMFVIYLFYYYKVRHINDNGTIIDTRKRKQKLFKIAVAMGATIGISQLFIAFNKISGGNFAMVEHIGIILLLVQQCIIVVSFRWIKILLFVQQCIIVISFRWVKNVYKAVCKKQ